MKKLFQIRLVYTNKKNLSIDELFTTNYFFPVIYLYLAIFLYIFYDFFSSLVLISLVC